jgi:hypothetical protein
LSSRRARWPAAIGTIELVSSRPINRHHQPHIWFRSVNSSNLLQKTRRNGRIYVLFIASLYDSSRRFRFHDTVRRGTDNILDELDINLQERTSNSLLNKRQSKFNRRNSYRDLRQWARQFLARPRSWRTDRRHPRYNHIRYLCYSVLDVVLLWMLWK